MVEAVYLQPGRFIESDDETIVAFARQTLAGAEAAGDIDRAVRLYMAVRDGILYDPYVPFARPESYSARHCLAIGRGFCVPKAALLAALARSSGIPARLGFADVRNHLVTPRLLEVNGSDILRWHAYTDLFLDGKWVKATPAFNLGLCERFGVKPLEFDGREDSIFHPYDVSGRRHMEYVLDRGTYADVPYEEILETARRHSPLLLRDDAFAGARGFAAEATPEQ